MGLQNNKEEEVQWKERGKRKKITNIDHIQMVCLQLAQLLLQMVTVPIDRAPVVVQILCTHFLQSSQPWKLYYPHFKGETTGGQRWMKASFLIDGRSEFQTHAYTLPPPFPSADEFW